jgi:hypothetical protein
MKPPGGKRVKAKTKAAKRTKGKELKVPVTLPAAGAPSVPPQPSPASQNSVTMTQAQKDKLFSRADMFNHSMSLLLNVMRRSGQELPSKDAQDFAYDAFIGFVPDGPGEIMLAQQMIASHDLAMSLLTRAKQAEFIPQLEQYGNLGVKLMNVYLAQFQALQKARKPQQVVQVQHTHRHVHLNGQAPPGDGVVTHIEGQPHERIDPAALALSPGPALLGQDPPGDALPVAKDEARQVPVARRR